MRLKRKHSDDESVEAKLTKEEKTESVVAEVGVGEVAEAGSGTHINMDKTTANREMLKIIKETPSNSLESSTLAILGVSVYNEANFKRQIQLTLTQGGDINIALIDASKHCQFHLVQPLVDLGSFY